MTVNATMAHVRVTSVFVSRAVSVAGGEAALVFLKIGGENARVRRVRDRLTDAHLAGPDDGAELR